MKLAKGIEAYIVMSRAQGLSFVIQASELRSFGRFAGEIEIHEVTPILVLSFLNRGKSSITLWRQRHSRLSKFFRHWFLLGVAYESHMPPTRGAARQVFTPYVYSRGEMKALLAACLLVPMSTGVTVHAETVRVLLLFLYGTGSRMSEAVAFRCTDADLRGGSIRLHSSRTGVTRTIPIGTELKRLLRGYVRWKNSLDLVGEPFFPTRDGSRVDQDKVCYRFNKMLALTGCVRRDGVNRKPRIFDLRATFAERQISKWIEAGNAMDRLLPALSGYMGHVDLTASEQFLAVTPQRFKKELNSLSPQKGKRWSDDATLMDVLGSL